MIKMHAIVDQLRDSREIHQRLKVQDVECNNSEYMFFRFVFPGCNKLGKLQDLGFSFSRVYI